MTAVIEISIVIEQHALHQSTFQEEKMEQFGSQTQETETKSAPRADDLNQQACGSAKTIFQQPGNNGDGVEAGERSEGAITKRIESMTSRVPSATFLSFAVASVGLALGLRMFGRKDDAQFVGHWVPTILTLGIYNKLVKLEGSE